MNLLKRFGFFSIGLIAGIVILMFFLGGKRASCDYSPTARTLKNIRNKERLYSEEAYRFFESNNIDTLSVNSMLEDGNVNFGKSQTDKEPCNIYFVSGEIKSNKLELQIENCEEIATIQRVEFLRD
ncbi:DUF4258 domain-containing protein [Gillisia limnaea]|uniref:DUF4258 domain-containing protein n=1 Tax=Gillisia limnaea (strain DSM 15749 / LMG 21470 / R-8282) TaxID=865937 RepID=H2BQW8_GILLR|nr:DUF4258 domain-containing protein [Gillisia limnaea]EHQ04287.1 hypothetical protein Gilli_0129 [Gillisia limnaea DSM 15749]